MILTLLGGASLYLRIIQHLLPKGRAWRITVNKVLRQFFQGLANALIGGVRAYIDDVWDDIFPSRTRELTAWEYELGLPSTGLTTAQRRTRLAATIAAEGGQSPGYIQDTLQAAGFDVCVHEWWESEGPPAVAKNPLVIHGTGGIGCGEALAECGETDMQCGNTTDIGGYILVNKIRTVEQDFVDGCGEEGMACGEEGAGCGAYSGFTFGQVDYEIPNDPTKWPYFLYIHGDTYEDPGFIDAARKDEFETLCLKICPAQQWLALFVLTSDEAIRMTLPTDPAATVALKIKMTANRRVKIDWGDDNFTEYTGTGAVDTLNHTYSVFPAGGATIWTYGEVNHILTWNINGEPFVLDMADIAPAVSLQSLDVGGSNATGDVASLATLTALTDVILEETDVSGNIGSLAPLINISELTVYDCSSLTYSQSTLPGWTDALIDLRLIGLSATEVDQFLIDLDAGGGYDGELKIASGNTARTSASDAAYTALLWRGWEIDGVIVTFMCQMAESGFDNLDESVTLRGSTVAAEGIYFAGGASALGWIAQVGGDLGYVAGTAPTFDDTSPLIGDSDGDTSVLFNAGGYFQSPAAVDMQLDTEDFVWHWYGESPPSGTKMIMETIGGAGTTGYQAYFSSGTFYFDILTPAGNQAVSYAIDPETWNDIYVICDKDYASGLVLGVNGAVVDTQNPTAVTGSMVSDKFTVGGPYGGMTQYNTHMSMIGLWKKASWFDGASNFTTDAAAFIKEQHAELIRTAADMSEGDAYPNTALRSGKGYIDHLESNGLSSYYVVGDNYIRQCERYYDGDVLAGLLTDTSNSMRMGYSNTFGSWTKTDVGDTVTDNASTAPNRKLDAADIIPDSTVGEHGITRASNSTAAANYVFSIHFRARAASIIKLECTTIANCYVWFDGATGDILTEGAAALGIVKQESFYAGPVGSGFSSGFSSGFDAGNTFFKRFGISFASTASVQTFKVLLCDSDGVSTYSAGDGAAVGGSVWAAQLEKDDHMGSIEETTGSGAVTRPFDNLIYTGDDGNVENNRQGAFVCDVGLDSITGSITKRVFSLTDNGDGNNKVEMNIPADGRLRGLSAATAESAGSTTGPVGGFDGAKHEARLRWEDDSFTASNDGIDGNTDTDCGMPDNLSDLDIGQSFTSGGQFSVGLIGRIRIINAPIDAG